jgi:hypothetical protein
VRPCPRQTAPTRRKAERSYERSRSVPRSLLGFTDATGNGSMGRAKKGMIVTDKQLADLEKYATGTSD